MSRRPPNPAAERAAQNQQTIKSLLKLEPNKVCADCKRNKHPRWASWNLGVFVCIRCSGIHRGMGTHISRVKSVDLDSWTDEQLQSILSWGNARANKYWEAKLAAGHVPSEAKIENFIRTKYELKRWVMDGPIPDPATLDVDGDDDIPLSIVKEKQTIDKKESIRKASVGASAAPSQPADLIGGDPIPQRASTVSPPAAKVAPKAGPAPPRASNAKDSLLGLDFFGSEQPAPPRPASTSASPGTGAAQSRPDLKQSILSLYASAPRPPPPQQATQQAPGAFGGMPSPTHGQPGAVGGLDDAFSGLSFATSSGPKSPPNDAFSGLGSISSSRSGAAQPSSAFSNLSGGGFFDSKPATAASSHKANASIGSSGGFGAFASPAPTAKPAAPAASSSFGDMLDFSAPTSHPAAAPAPKPVQTAVRDTSVFNLSSAQTKPAPPVSSVSNTAGSTSNNAWSNSDVWGGNAWGAPDAGASGTKMTPPAPVSTSTTNDFGWGSSSVGGSGTGSFASQSIVPGAAGGFSAAPKVAADEEFGGWSGGPGASTVTGTSKPAAGAGNNEDLFSNVWE